MCEPPPKRSEGKPPAEREGGGEPPLKEEGVGRRSEPPSYGEVGGNSFQCPFISFYKEERPRHPKKAEEESTTQRRRREAVPPKEGVDRSDKGKAPLLKGGGEGEVHLSFFGGAPFLLLLGVGGGAFYLSTFG